MKLNIKSAAVGFLIGTIGVTTVFASTGISSANFSAARVYFYGREVPLENQLILITKDGETSAQMYMPMRELLENMNFIVEWDSENNAVNLTMMGNPGAVTNSPGESGNVQPQWIEPGVLFGFEEHPSTLAQNEAGRRAIDIMQRTGNWRFIEVYLPYISNEDIQAVVDIFNSRQNPNNRKRAADYMS
ncbi:MAG: hypothetical protein FWE20_07325 [Defluviitaleaceae bacterium]|nr:hypothetical protein [Defluviitaleaceae bacterium]